MSCTPHDAMINHLPYVTRYTILRPQRDHQINDHLGKRHLPLPSAAWCILFSCFMLTEMFMREMNNNYTYCFFHKSVYIYSGIKNILLSKNCMYNCMQNLSPFVLSKLWAQRRTASARWGWLLCTMIAIICQTAAPPKTNTWEDCILVSTHR